MTLRQSLGEDVGRIQRAISFGQGFGVSPCQLELVTVEIARAVRGVGGAGRITNRVRRRRSGTVEGRGAQRALAA